MSPNKTGTRMTSNWTVAAPRFLWGRLVTCGRLAIGPFGEALQATRRLTIGGRLPTCPTISARLVIRFWFLVPTRSYKFRLLLVLRPFFLRLLLLHSRQKWLDRIRQLSLFVRREGTDEPRCYHHQQLIVGLGRGSAAEQLPQDWNVAEPFHLVDGLDDAIVDQTRACETLAVFQHHFRFSAPRGQWRNQETLQLHGVGEVQRTDLRPHLQIDGAAGGNGGREITLHTVWVALHRNHLGHSPVRFGR